MNTILITCGAFMSSPGGSRMIMIGNTSEQDGVTKVAETWVELRGIPCISREKVVLLEYPKGEIKGVRMTSYNLSNPDPVITSGGLACKFVNVKCESDSGSKLDCHIEIFACVTEDDAASVSDE